MGSLPLVRSCASCAQPIALVAGRWVHLTPSPIGLRPRPSFVGCAPQGTPVWRPTVAAPRPLEAVA